MSDKFSDLFKDGINETSSPLYTACVSVLLYKALDECGLIAGDDTFDICIRYKKYEVPNGYTLSLDTKHCWCQLYWFNYYDKLENGCGTKILCDAADCKKYSNPEQVANEIRYGVAKCRIKDTTGKPSSTKW